MAQFDVSFLNPKLRKASGGNYGTLIDQLDILQSKLESDGKLSPGDYDLLVDKAQELYSAPGMTDANRSNILVKIERYKSQKKSNGLKDASNVTNINNDTRDDQIKANMLLSKNPNTLVRANIEITRNKLDQLKDAADAAEASGENASAYLIAYNETLQNYSDLLDVKAQMDSYQPGGNKPIPGYAAYVTTNAKGEVTDVRIARSGELSGYAETTGVYGGLQVYGKARRENGKLVFKMGRESFSAADIPLPDPMNPGAFRATTLTADSQKTPGRMTRSTAGQYTDINTNDVRSQTAVPAGSYARGQKGFFYKALEDGTYQKIVNADIEKLGVAEEDILNLPREMENTTITPRVSTTTDYSLAPLTPLPTTINEGSPSPVTDAGSTTPAEQNQSQGNTASSTSRTKSPTERSPSSISGYASKAFGAAKGFFGSLFGK